MTCSFPSDVKQKILSISNPSTPLKSKKSDVELLLNLSMQSDDFTKVVKESDGILVLTTVFKNSNDFALKARITTFLLFLSCSEHGDSPTENLMNEVNVLSLANLLLEKDFGIFMQSFSSLKVLGDHNSSPTSPDSKQGFSFSLSASIVFLENISSLFDPSSTVLSDLQKAELIPKFTQFVLTGVMASAAADAARDSNTALSKKFSVAYEKFVKCIEAYRKNDYSLLDMLVMPLLQLIKDGKFITPSPVVVPGGLTGHLDVINKWLGGSKKFALLYKAANDGFTAAAFHSKCDNKGATVTVITCTEGWVFGGYTPLSWDSSNSYSADNTKQSFLFSLKNPHNLQPTKFDLIKPQYAIVGNKSCGPVFGGNNDLCCANNSNSGNCNCHTVLNHTYSNTTGLKDNEVCTGKQQFTAKDIEVYSAQ